MIYSRQADFYPKDAEGQYRRHWGPLLAAIPHLWMGATIIIGLLDGYVLTNLPDESLSIVSDISLVLLLTAGLMIAGYASRHDSPIWAASWSSYTIIALVVVPGRMILLQDPDYMIYQMGFLALAGLAIAILYFLRFRRQPLHALQMSLIFILLTPLLALDDIPYSGECLFILLLSVLAASVAAVAVFLRQWAFGSMLALGASLLASFVLAVVCPSVAYSSAAASGGLLLSSGIFLTCSLLSVVILYGPWMFWNVVDSGRSMRA